MDRCPMCRGRLAEAVCQRCGADYALVLAAERLAAHRLRRAIAALRAGRLDVARAAARQARALHRTPFAVVLNEFLAAVSGEG